MEDFLTILKLQLMDRLEPDDLEEQLQMYRDYINDQLEQGRTMDQVLAKLGDPEKVADLIVEHDDKVHQQQEEFKRREWERWSKDMSVDEINAQIENPPGDMGIHAEYKENEGWDVRLGKLKLNAWYGTLIILGIVLVIFILISQLIR